MLIVERSKVWTGSSELVCVEIQGVLELRYTEFAGNRKGGFAVKGMARGCIGSTSAMAVVGICLRCEGTCPGHEDGAMWGITTHAKHLASRLNSDLTDPAFASADLSHASRH